MIDSIQIICERHSGSNWFKSLLKNTFQNIQVNDLEKHWFVDEYKLKHFLETSSSPTEKMKNHCINRGINFNTFNNITTDNILVIILVRNVYDWILGMKRDPHHFENKWKISEMQVSDFIRMEWNNVRDITPYSVPVENVVDLRTKKYMNWFKYIPKCCKNYTIISYESLLVNWFNIALWLNTHYKLKFTQNEEDFFQWKTSNQKRNQSLYFNKNLISKYFSKKDLLFIEKYVKLDIEKELDYNF